jgi:hypothetical protein
MVDIFYPVASLSLATSHFTSSDLYAIGLGSLTKIL